LSDAEGNQAATGPVAGEVEYAPAVFQKIVRQAMTRVSGLRLEPLEGSFLRRRGRVTAGKEGLNVPLQVEYGRRIPELTGEAQRAIAAEIGRLLGYQEVPVNIRVCGLYSPGGEGGS